jgi:hypothetical protein
VSHIVYAKRLRLNFGLAQSIARLPPFYALYFVSVRQNYRFANGFLQICSHPQHPCQLLTLPINSARTETFTLLVLYHTWHTNILSQIWDKSILTLFIGHKDVFFLDVLYIHHSLSFISINIYKLCNLKSVNLF